MRDSVSSWVLPKSTQTSSLPEVVSLGVTLLRLGRSRIWTIGWMPILCRSHTLQDTGSQIVCDRINFVNSIAGTLITQLRFFLSSVFASGSLVRVW